MTSAPVSSECFYQFLVPLICFKSIKVHYRFSVRGTKHCYRLCFFLLWKLYFDLTHVSYFILTVCSRIQRNNNFLYFMKWWYFKSDWILYIFITDCFALTLFLILNVQGRVTGTRVRLLARIQRSVQSLAWPTSPVTAQALHHGIT